MIHLESICKKTLKAIESVGEFIRTEALSFSSSSVEYKAQHDLVSYVDRTAEQRLVELLSPILPGSGFITEEDQTREISSEYNWIIDPLDGTTNFVHGLPCYCISIGLMKDNKIVLGIVYEINFREFFYAWENGNAFMNNKIIRCSKTNLFSQSLLATGFPSLNYDRLDEFMEVFKHCMQHTRGLRRLGSAAADLAYVACGRLDGFFEYGLSSWDVAGGSIIVKEAGGMVSDFKGEENYIFGKEILASNQAIHPDFLKAMRKFYEK